MRKFKITIQDSISLFALAMSMLALWFTWKQVDISQIHNRLSVMPILQLTPYLEGPGKRNGLYLTNDGLGPAIISEFSVKFRDVEFKGFESDRWEEIISALELTPECFAQGWPRDKAVIKSEIETPIIYVTSAPGMEMCLFEGMKLFGGEPVFIEIEYESIYGERKILSTDSKIRSKLLERYVELLSKIGNIEPNGP